MAAKQGKKVDHECETPLDGAIQHRWTCKVCGQEWEVVNFDDRGNPIYELGEVSQ